MVIGVSAVITKIANSVILFALSQISLAFASIFSIVIIITPWNLIFCIVFKLSLFWFLFPRNFFCVIKIIYVLQIRIVWSIYIEICFFFIHLLFLSKACSITSSWTWLNQNRCKLKTIFILILCMVNIAVRVLVWVSETIIFTDISTHLSDMSVSSLGCHAPYLAIIHIIQ